MTGSEFLQSVCQHNYPATLILFTGYADIKSVIDAVNTGRLYRYLTKPWDPGHLIELLHEAAAEYDRRVAFQDLSQNLERYVSLGLQITKQLGEIAGQSGGIDQNTLATFTQACRSLAEVSESASELGSGDS